MRAIFRIGGDESQPSLRKQLTFPDAVNCFPAKGRLRNEPRNYILMTRRYPDLDSASDWSSRVGNLFQLVRNTTLSWVVTRHQYGISTLVSQTSLHGETSGGVAKCRLFSQAKVSPASSSQKAGYAPVSDALLLSGERVT